MLTTLPIVKTRLGLAVEDVKDDELLNLFIQLVSARFEHETNRRFGYSATSDEFEADETELRLSRYPIDPDAAISFHLQTSATLGWEPVVVDFVIRKSCILSLSAQLSQDRQQLRVTYTGGYILPDQSDAPLTAPALPEEISTTVAEQVVFLYSNKSRPGISAISGKDASLQIAALDLLPSVQSVIKKYERWMP
jgi:hypothetical protein